MEGNNTLLSSIKILWKRDDLKEKGHDVAIKCRITDAARHAAELVALRYVFWHREFVFDAFLE